MLDHLTVEFFLSSRENVGLWSTASLLAEFRGEAVVTARLSLPLHSRDSCIFLGVASAPQTDKTEDSALGRELPLSYTGLLLLCPEKKILSPSDTKH